MTFEDFIKVTYGKDFYIEPWQLEIIKAFSYGKISQALPDRPRIRLASVEHAGDTTIYHVKRFKG